MIKQILINFWEDIKEVWKDKTDVIFLTAFVGFTAYIVSDLDALALIGCLLFYTFFLHIRYAGNKRMVKKLEETIKKLEKARNK